MSTNLPAILIGHLLERCASARRARTGGGSREAGRDWAARVLEGLDRALEQLAAERSAHEQTRDELAQAEQALELERTRLQGAEDHHERSHGRECLL